MFDVGNIKTPDDARTLMDNARKLGRTDVYQAAFRRLGFLEGQNYEDPVVRQFWGAVAAVEEMLRLKHGKRVRASYTRRKAAQKGEIVCLIDWALKKRETEGFRLLVEAGLVDQTGEYVVLSNPDRFDSAVVNAAAKRLSPILQKRIQ